MPPLNKTFCPQQEHWGVYFISCTPKQTASSLKFSSRDWLVRGNRARTLPPTKTPCHSARSEEICICFCDPHTGTGSRSPNIRDLSPKPTTFAIPKRCHPEAERGEAE
jgi:hypothetical protein